MHIKNILLLLRHAKGNLNGCLASCSNTGRCVVNATDKKFGCVCDDELYMGENCDEINPLVCSPSKCLNNGTCTSLYQGLDFYFNFTFNFNLILLLGISKEKSLVDLTVRVNHSTMDQTASTRKTLARY